MSKKSSKNFRESIKIILVGNSGVGKTSIINRYYSDEFHSSIDSTISMNFVLKDVSIKGRTIQLNIWDTLGQEKYFSCNKLFIKNSNIVILVYDITRKNSFEGLEYWYNSINSELGKDFFLGLVGNKFDRINEEEVSEEEGMDKAKAWEPIFPYCRQKVTKMGLINILRKLLRNIFILLILILC